jgi:hypothetical protein
LSVCFDAVCRSASGSFKEALLPSGTVGRTRGTGAARSGDGGSGETSATSIVCDNTGTTPDTTPATGWDDSVTHEDIRIDPSPRTITCTIVIDP